MSGRTQATGFAARPGGAEDWIRAADTAPVPIERAANAFTARLTIDVTPAVRQRLKLAALTRGTTVADLIRTLLAHEFPESSGGPT